MLTLVGTPAWANGGRAPNFAPPQPRDFRRFATAAATRYPWVRYWLIWNEPNKRLWLRPTKAAIYVQHLLNPGYEAIHAVLPHARVGGGVTAPRGGLGGVAPVAWVRGMAAAHAKLDAYAHHPYPSTPGETPSSGGCKNCPSITMATIRKLLILVRRSFGSKPIWLTEYGYQTNPPDTFLGVPPKRQATKLSLAAMRAWRLPRVTMLIQYLYRDEPALSRFQTGLVFVDDRWKPSLQAFRLPFAQMGRHGLQAVVWGQIRGGRPGRKSYRLEVLHKNVWKPVGRARLTNDARRLHPDDSAQARRAAPDLVAAPATRSASSCGSGEANVLSPEGRYSASMYVQTASNEPPPKTRSTLSRRSRRRSATDSSVGGCPSIRSEPPTQPSTPSWYALRNSVHSAVSAAIVTWSTRSIRKPASSSAER